MLTRHSILHTRITYCCCCGLIFLFFFLLLFYFVLSILGSHRVTERRKWTKEIRKQNRHNTHKMIVLILETWYELTIDKTHEISWMAAGLLCEWLSWIFVVFHSSYFSHFIRNKERVDFFSLYLFHLILHLKVLLLVEPFFI